MTVAMLNLTVKGKQREVLIDCRKHPNHVGYYKSDVKADDSMPVMKEIEWLDENHGPVCVRTSARCFELTRNKRGSDKDVADVLKTGVVIMGIDYRGDEPELYCRFVPYNVLTTLYSKEGAAVPHIIVLASREGKERPHMNWFPVANWTLVNDPRYM